MFKLVRVVFMFKPKGRYKTGMIKLVRVVFVYRPKGRYETGMFKLAGLFLCIGLRDDVKLVCSI